ncbi:MAG: class I SAM-dependent methyltransferase [Candidatus Dormibacteraeota bacterium]|nr:class I SAM-dependent methyltransferase [Candidatus Dormibacteraeota bacterium]
MNHVPDHNPAMGGNPVRDLHDEVARSDDPVIASTRPGSTTVREMQRMVDDVLTKLRPDGVTVIELGCGTGVLGVPIARRASAYTGVDVSREAVAVLRERLPAADVRCLDVTRDDLTGLGTFDRVLVYAVLHYVTTETEGSLFVRNALSLLKPGGVALFGNLPMPSADLPHTVVQRVAGMAWSAARRLGRPRSRTQVGGLPPGYCLPLTRLMIDGWVGSVRGTRSRWLTPRLGTPMQRTRADLLVEKQGDGSRR